MKLLIVEDDKATIQSYEDNIESFNKSIDFEITPVIKDNIETAKKALTSPEYDAAIVDLKLSSNTTVLEGIEIVNDIYNKLRFPVFIVSGSIGQVEYEENTFLKKRSRDGDFKDILNEITAIYNTGITKILGRSGQINDYLNKIFWNHLSNSLDVWVNDSSRSPEDKQKSLLRYTLLHMLEYLDENNVHPSEFYLTRPVKENLSTGDLVLLNGNRYVVLTPACDFVYRSSGDRNIRKAFLLKIIELNDHFTNLEESIQKKEISKTLQGKLEKIITNNKPYYHFIPKHSAINAGIIDFQDKLSIPIEDIEAGIKNKEIDRFATITLPFLKDLIERYSSYYARQGSPDFNVEDIINTFLSE